MYSNPPAGMTPPSPGLEREEPELAIEEDIPMDEDTAEEGTREIERE